MSEPESQKEQTDRQLIELLTELRVVLPGAQVLLAFLLTVPFAARFGGISRPRRVGFFTSLLFTAIGTVLLMAPSSIIGSAGGVAARRMLFEWVIGCSLLEPPSSPWVCSPGSSWSADFLYGALAAGIATTAVAACILVTWYALALTRGRSAASQQEE